MMKCEHCPSLISQDTNHEPSPRETDFIEDVRIDSL
jgi:hypothetical protein